MKQSIFIKVFIGFVLIIILLTSFILIYSFRTTRAYYIDLLTSNLEHLAVALSQDVSPLIKNNRFDDLDRNLKTLGNQIQTRITIIAWDGSVLADSEEDPEIMENHAKRPEIVQAYAGSTGVSMRYSTTVGKDMLYVAIPVNRSGNPIAVLRVSLYVEGIEHLIDQLQSRILLFAVVALLLSVLGALWISRSISRPIKELRSVSQQIAGGDFDARVMLRRRDEMKELAESFNQMADTIKALFDDVSRQKEELNSLITSIRASLFVVDPDGRVSMANESFKEVMRGREVEGKFWWEVLREPSLNELIGGAIEKKQSTIEEVEFGNRIFICSVSVAGSKVGVIGMLHDITAIRNLELIKRDFVHNVSHELRTPLTAIKGYVETLKEGDNEEKERYIQVIRRHTDRLIGIVDDLLALSELEEGSSRFEPRKMSVMGIIENLLVIFQPRIAEKDLTLEFEAEKELPDIEADPYRLEQLLINLLDNAVKYTDRGGITIRLAPNDIGISIEIRDTGIGIPAEHHTRIFERFYVVNKSRSRKVGGTGLGLSIVKHILKLHNGRITLDSRPGEGSTFTVILPTRLS
jgi:two-component system phosphate regulon sensor histidine kinase PhoR